MNVKYIPPPNFGHVEDDLYRCGQPSALNFPFLAKLKLHTIIYLAPESPTQQFLNFIKDQDINLVHLGGYKGSLAQMNNNNNSFADDQQDDGESAASSTPVQHQPHHAHDNDNEQDAHLYNASTHQGKKQNAAAVQRQKQQQVSQQQSAFYSSQYNTMGLVSEELVIEALNIILDPSKYPMAVMCNLGRHRTGTCRSSIQIQL